MGYVQKDTFNQFCIDCQKNQTTHFSVSFGVLICEPCAQEHQKHKAMDKDYIKSLTGELYDPFQLKVLEVGGNKAFYDFMKGYNYEKEPIKLKYDHRAARWYRSKLCRSAMGTPFEEKPPVRNVSDVGDSLKDAASGLMGLFNKKK